MNIDDVAIAPEAPNVDSECTGHRCETSGARVISSGSPKMSRWLMKDSRLRMPEPLRLRR